MNIYVSSSNTSSLANINQPYLNHKEFTEIYCWGSNQYGQIGIPNNEFGLDSYTKPKVYNFNIIINQISCGEEHTLFISDGYVYSMGNNLDGRLGIGNKQIKQSNFPYLIQSLTRFKASKISCGARHSAVIVETGDIFTWGNNEYGQLGLGNLTTYYSPQRVTTMTIPSSESYSKFIKVKDVSCGNKHTAVITVSGEVFAWGSNDQGQLGIGKLSADNSLPSKIKTLNNEKIQKISCGESHTLFLTSSAKVYACGSNNSYQLGFKEKKIYYLPMKINELDKANIIKICAGYHSAAISHFGDLYIWGTSSLGEITSPKIVQNSSELPVFDVKMGANFTLILDIEGKIWGFGNNAYGELGNGDYESRNIMTKVCNLSKKKVNTLACGKNFAIALGSSFEKQTLDELEEASAHSDVDIPRLQPRFMMNNSTNTDIEEGGGVSNSDHSDDQLNTNRMIQFDEVDGKPKKKKKKNKNKQHQHLDQKDKVDDIEDVEEEEEEEEDKNIRIMKELRESLSADSSEKSMRIKKNNYIHGDALRTDPIGDMNLGGGNMGRSSEDYIPQHRVHTSYIGKTKDHRDSIKDLKRSIKRERKSMHVGTYSGSNKKYYIDDDDDNDGNSDNVDINDDDDNSRDIDKKWLSNTKKGIDKSNEKAIEANHMGYENKRNGRYTMNDLENILADMKITKIQNSLLTQELKEKSKMILRMENEIKEIKNNSEYDLNQKYGKKHPHSHPHSHTHSNAHSIPHNNYMMIHKDFIEKEKTINKLLDELDKLKDENRWQRQQLINRDDEIIHKNKQIDAYLKDIDNFKNIIYNMQEERKNLKELCRCYQKLKNIEMEYIRDLQRTIKTYTPKKGNSSSASVECNKNEQKRYYEEKIKNLAEILGLENILNEQSPIQTTHLSNDYLYDKRSTHDINTRSTIMEKLHNNNNNNNIHQESTIPRTTIEDIRYTPMVSPSHGYYHKRVSSFKIDGLDLKNDKTKDRQDNLFLNKKDCTNILSNYIKRESVPTSTRKGKSDIYQHSSKRYTPLTSIRFSSQLSTPKGFAPKDYFNQGITEGMKYSLASALANAENAHKGDNKKLTGGAGLKKATDKDTIIRGKEGLMRDKDGLIRDKDGLIRDKDGLIRDKDGLIRDKDNLMLEMEARRNLLNYSKRNYPKNIIDDGKMTKKKHSYSNSISFQASNNLNPNTKMNNNNNNICRSRLDSGNKKDLESSPRTIMQNYQYETSAKKFEANQLYNKLLGLLNSNEQQIAKLNTSNFNIQEESSEKSSHMGNYMFTIGLC